MEQRTLFHTALVTGGSRGIGRAVCLLLAERGYSVCIGYAGREDAAMETRKLCIQSAASSSQIFSVCRADAGTEEGARNLVETALLTLGSLEVLVNCAGITRDSLLIVAKTEDLDAVLQTDLRSVLLVTRAAVKPMLRQRYGRIVSISSVVGLHGNAGQSAYAAAKAGIIGFTKSVAKEFAGKGITANAVAPGMIETDMTSAMPERAREAALSLIPMGRMGTPKEAAEAVCFLASERAAYITGQVLAADGGMGM